MSKDKKQKNKQKNSNVKNETAISNANFSASEMETIIANAIIKAEELKERKKKEIEEKEIEELNKYLGKNKVFRFFKALFLPKDKIKGDKASVALLQLCLSGLFSIAMCIAFFASIVFIVGGIASFFIQIETPISLVYKIWFVVIGIVFLLFAFIFRIVSVEVEKMEDKNIIFGLFASVTSIVSIIIAIVSIIKN